MRAFCLLIVLFFLTACQPQRALKLEAPPADAHSVKVITPDWAVASTLTAPVSYTHLTLPTICSV